MESIGSLSEGCWTLVPLAFVLAACAQSARDSEARLPADFEAGVQETSREVQDLPAVGLGQFAVQLPRCFVTDEIFGTKSRGACTLHFPLAERPGLPVQLHEGVQWVDLSFWLMADESNASKRLALLIDEMGDRDRIQDPAVIGDAGVLFDGPGIRTDDDCGMLTLEARSAAAVLILEVEYCRTAAPVDYLIAIGRLFLK